MVRRTQTLHHKQHISKDDNGNTTHRTKILIALIHLCNRSAKDGPHPHNESVENLDKTKKFSDFEWKRKEGANFTVRW